MSQKPFVLLHAIADQSRALRTKLPARENAQKHWNGLGFSLLGQRFVVPMGDVAELMRVPSATRLPGVKHFVVGVANVRGRLMSILDLAAFFNTTSTMNRAQRRILAFEDEERFIGFVVDESLGMQHFPQDAFSNEIDVADMFKPFVRGGYRVGDNDWPILSLNTLADHEALESLALEAG